MTNIDQLTSDVIATQKTQLTRDINKILETLEAIPPLEPQVGEGNYLYKRVSSDEQEDNTSLETQEEKCLELAALDGTFIPETNRFGENYTGKLLRPRKELAKLRKLIWEGKVKRLYLYKFDRLSRNQTHMHILMNEREEHGVELRCVTETFENSAIGKMVMALRAFVAESELENIRMRTQTGKRARAEKGYLLAAHRRYGYDHADVVDGNGKVWQKARYIVNPKNAAMVRIIYYLRVCKRYSKKKILTVLNEQGVPSPYGKQWSAITISDILNFAGYATGTMYLYNKQHIPRKESENLKSRYKIVDGDDSQKIAISIPTIIPLEWFEKAQRLEETIPSDNARNCRDPEGYLLRNGFIYCGYCGCSMQARVNNFGLKHYRCFCRKYGKTPCKGQSISSTSLDSAVWSWIGEVIEDYSLIEQALQHWKQEADYQHDFRAIQKSIDDLVKQQDQLMEDLRRKDENGNPYLQGRMRDLALKDAQDLEGKLQRFREMLDDTRKGKQEIQEIIKGFEAFVNRCLTIKEAYETANYQEKRDILRFFGIKVRIYREGDSNHPGRYEIDVMPEIFKESSRTKSLLRSAERKSRYWRQCSPSD